MRQAVNRQPGYRLGTRRAFCASRSLVLIRSQEPGARNQDPRAKHQETGSRSRWRISHCMDELPDLQSLSKLLRMPCTFKVLQAIVLRVGTYAGSYLCVRVLQNTYCHTVLAAPHVPSARHGGSFVLSSILGNSCFVTPRVAVVFRRHI